MANDPDDYVDDEDPWEEIPNEDSSDEEWEEYGDYLFKTYNETFDDDYFD